VFTAQAQNRASDVGALRVQIDNLVGHLNRSIYAANLALPFGRFMVSTYTGRR